MGCKLSKAVKTKEKEAQQQQQQQQNGMPLPKTIPAENTDGKNGTETVSTIDVVKPELTPEQKALIGNTWQLLVENVARVGVITFMSLFETHPDVQDVFMPFKGLKTEDLKYSKELRAHALRVMGFVQKIVARIDEPAKVEQLLAELGRNHVTYGAKAEYVDLVGPQFIFAIKPSLEDHWNESIEDAWAQLFRYMAFIIKQAMYEVQQEQKRQMLQLEKEFQQKQQETISSRNDGAPESSPSPTKT